jgi:hypothetical protein
LPGDREKIDARAIFDVDAVGARLDSGRLQEEIDGAIPRLLEAFRQAVVRRQPPPAR